MALLIPSLNDAEDDCHERITQRLNPVTCSTGRDA